MRSAKIPEDRPPNNLSPYARAELIVADACTTLGVEPEVAAYMLARLALLSIGARRGRSRAAEVAYKLADEMAVQSLDCADK